MSKKVCENSANFFGSGDPELRRQFVTEDGVLRFPIVGDSYTETNLSEFFIYRDNEISLVNNNTSPKWNLIPNSINLETMSKVYQKNINAVVRIACISNADIVAIPDNFTGPKLFNLFASGAGFFISDDGMIATATHIILTPTPPEDPNVRWPIQDNILVQIFPENQIFNALVVGYDNKTDVAVLKINLPNNLLPRNFLSIINSRNVPIGSPAIALSHPNQVDTPASSPQFINQRPNIQSISFGVITDNKFTDDTMHVESVVTDIQYTTPVNGGPLIDLKGNCIGITSWIIRRTNDLYEIRGAVAGYLAMEVVRVFRAGYNFNGSLHQEFIKYTSALRLTYFTNFNLISIRGISLSPQLYPQVVAGVFINNIITDRDGFQEEIELLPDFVAAGLSVGDVIIKAGPVGVRPLLDIGKANNQYSLDTIVILNPVIDIVFLKAGDNFTIEYPANDLHLESLSLPQLVRFDFQYTKIS